MSDYAASTVSESADTNQTRGRIPKAMWGYIGEQKLLKDRTLEDIGNEFNCTPSAVHYVVAQVKKIMADPGFVKPEGENVSLAQSIDAAIAAQKVMERMRPPTEGTAAAFPATRTIVTAKRDFEWASQKARHVVAPPQPSQDEQIAKANDLLTDEGCMRLFQASSKVIGDYNGFKATPDENGKKQVKNAIHETRRALANLELKVEMMQLNPASPAHQAQRIPEPA